MFDSKTIVNSILTTILVIAGLSFMGLVGGNDQLGSGTRFPNGISADSTSPVAGEVRGTTATITGVSTLSGGTSGPVRSEVVTADDTIAASQSGETFFLDGTAGATSTLPAVSAGANVRFVVADNFATNNWVIDSAEGDNISGTLMVAGAQVLCAAEDQINFIVDGELIGDYVELLSDGTNWYIIDSHISASTKGTCTDPT